LNSYNLFLIFYSNTFYRKDICRAAIDTYVKKSPANENEITYEDFQKNTGMGVQVNWTTLSTKTKLLTKIFRKTPAWGFKLTEQHFQRLKIFNRQIRQHINICKCLQTTNLSLDKFNCVITFTRDVYTLDEYLWMNLVG